MQPARGAAGRMNADGVSTHDSTVLSTTFAIQRSRLIVATPRTLNASAAASGSIVATARVLLRDISKILFPNNPVNVPVIK